MSPRIDRSVLSFSLWHRNPFPRTFTIIIYIFLFFLFLCTAARRSAARFHDRRPCRARRSTQDSTMRISRYFLFSHRTLNSYMLYRWLVFYRIYFSKRGWVCCTWFVFLMVLLAFFFFFLCFALDWVGGSVLRTRWGYNKWRNILLGFIALFTFCSSTDNLMRVLFYKLLLVCAGLLN